MDYDITDSLRSIFTDLDKNINDGNTAEESSRLLVQLNKYFEEEEINPISLDNYLLFIFNKENGVIRFVHIVLSKPAFKKAKLQYLELLYLLVNNFSSKMEKHFLEMNKLCLTIMKNSITTADEKVRALKLIYLMLEKININFEYTNDYLDLYKTLHHCLSRKLGDSVTEKVYECLGLYVYYLDYTLKPEEAKNLRNLLLFKIKEETAKDYSKKLVTGLFNGLRHIQERMPFDPADDKKHVDELYDIIKKLSEYASKVKIKMPCRAGLLFLHRNIPLFRERLFNDHKFWYQIMCMWIDTLGSEEKKLGSQVILSIFRGVCTHLMEGKKPEYKNILKSYLGGFCKTLNKAISDLAKQACIRGIGIFFKAAPILLSSREVSNFSLKLLHTFRLTYVVDQNYTSDEWVLLPEYIEMVASIVVSKGMERGEILLLKQGLVVLLKHYSHIPILSRFKVRRAFLLAVHSVVPYEYFDAFLNDLIYQSVIWSCSYHHVSEFNEDDKQAVTILTYLPFWRGILNSDLKNDSDDWELDTEEKRKLSEQIVKKLIATLLICIDKLDVSMKYRENHLTDLKDSIEINKKNDFVIFLNIVDFYERLLDIINPEHVKRYIHRLMNFFIGRSLRFPLISGFYRLLTVCLRIADKLNYFDEIEGSKECLKTLEIYMQSLFSNISQYEDELLISCLKVLLECPARVIEEMLPACISPFITIFTIGRHYLPVADLGICTLEKWQKSLKYQSMEDFLGKIAAKLDAFLRSKSLAYLAPEFQKRNKYNKALGKRKMEIEIEPELVKLQRKILRFLGKQPASVCERILDSQRIVTDIWSDKEHLKVTLPFPDVKLDVQLDQMIPIIVELALYNSDRKTRVTACELLQALVVLFLGLSKQMPNSGQQELAGVLKKFAMPILELGCDPDEVVRGLFEPLVLQMIHWYSSPMQSGECHKAIILEALIKGVCCPTNANLRLFSGKCTGEFVQWTIKQSADAMNIKVLVRRMRFLSSHPDKFKKLGAALMFNNFYVFLREERNLLNAFWIEIFEIFVTSLHSIEDTFENKTVISQIFASLNHLKRGFTEKASLFNTKDRTRRKPHGFSGTCLVDVLNFLLKNIGSKGSLCREKSAELFSSMVAFCSDLKHHSDYFQHEDPLHWLKNTSEGHVMEQKNLGYTEGLLQWMIEVQRAIDGLIFLVKNATVTNRNLEDIATIRSLQYYLEHVATNDIRMPTVFDRRAFGYQKNKINKKVLVLLHNTLEHNCKTEYLWNGNLWRLMVSLTFDLEHSASKEEKIDKEVERFLLSAVEKLPMQKVEELSDHFKNHIGDNFSDDFDLNLPICPKQHKTINGMIFLTKCGLNFKVLYPKMVQKLMQSFLTTCSRTGRISLSDEEVSYYSLILEFGIHNELEEFLKFLFLPDQIDEIEGGKKRTFGSFLLDSFETAVIPKILDHFDEFLAFSITKERIALSVGYMKNILRYITRFRGNIFWPDFVLNKLADRWEHFKSFFCENFSNLIEGLEVVKILNSVEKATYLTTSLILSILKNEIFLYCEDPLEKNLVVLEFIFENLDVHTEDQNAPFIKTALDRILTYVSQKSDKNTQNLCLINISKLYHVLGRSRSNQLFEFIFICNLMFPEFENHIKDIAVVEKYVSNLSVEKERKIMDICVNLMSSPEFSADRKLGLGKQILMTVFQKASLEASEQYFLTNIQSILKILLNPTSQDNLCAKIVNFILVEIMFVRIPVGDDSETSRRMLQAAAMDNSDQKVLLRCLLRCTLLTFKEKVHVEPKNDELLRICRCHSYNTLVSIAVNSLNDPQFHDKLFVRIEGNEDILWKNLVDCKKVYNFEKDFISLPQKRKITVNIRNFSTNRSASADFSTGILRSQRIFNCSLSEDVTRHDLSNVTLKLQTSSENKNENAIEMDHVQVNDHECMATVCALINHLNDTHLSNLDENVKEVPSYLIGLRHLLLKENTPVNVKIFLVKVIENTSHVFINYSKWFITPVMKFILDKCAGDEMNFFINDLVVMLANWSAPLDVYELSLAAKVIEFLFYKLSTGRRDMFKYNLGLIRILVEGWKDNLFISESFLRLILSNNSQEAERETQFISILLVNNLFVFNEETIKELLTFASNQLSSSKKIVYMSCSEMLGIFLKELNEDNVSRNREEVESMIRNSWEHNSDKGGNILEGISIHYPEFLRENHIIRLFSRLGNVTPTSQHTFLKIMLRVIPVLENVYEFRTERWEKYLNSESSEVQITTLSLMEKTLHILEKEPSFHAIISAICEKKNSQNDLCKKIAFDIVMKVCTIHFEDSSRFSDSIDICKDSLIEGLALDNKEIAQTVKNFWINSNMLSSNLTERFIQCFSSIYKPKTEEVILGTGLTFLLSLLKGDEDYNRKLFDYPLEDCNFEDYELSVNPSSQHPYEVPMFAETFLSSSTLSKAENRFKFGELRATQDDFTFAPTVSSKQDEAIFKFVSSQSSLFSDSRNVSAFSDDFKNPNDYKSEFKVFKRRFLKSSSKISDHCANFEVRSKMEKVQKRVKVAKGRDRQVCITRKYRKGDFPDIQIPLSSIIEPLQKLASENSEVAKILYTNLFKKLEVKKKMSNDNWSDLTQIISTIFGTSLEFNTNLFRTLFDFIIISKSKIKLDPYLITDCCLSSSLISTGTLIIEDYLMHAEPEKPQAKRIKGTNATEEGVYWIKLAELYKELNEWDVVCSIFQNKVPSIFQDNFLSTAISSESRKLWAQARDSYRHLMEKDLTADNKDFYHEAYFKCFANLGQWNNISETIKSSEGPGYWNNLWEDDWKQKKLLPWYVTAEVNDMLFKEQLSVTLLENINVALCDNRKAEHLKSTYPEHIATLWMLNGDLDAAEMYLRSSMDSFLNQWQILDPMFRNVRFKKILKLRSCTTIYEFIDIYRMFGTVEMEKIFECLEILWTNTHHSTSYPSMLQETGILHFKQFMSLIQSKISSLDDPEFTPYLGRIKDWKLKLNLGLVDTALKENNFYLARKYLESHKNERGIGLHLAKMMFIKSHHAKSSADSLRTMMKSLEMIVDLRRNEVDKESLLKIHLTTFEILGEILGLIDCNGDLRDKLDEVQMIIVEGHGIFGRERLKDYGANLIYEFLESNTLSESMKINDKSLSDAHLTVAYYMVEKEAPEVDILSKMVLRAMKLGAAEARLLFPILLQQEHLGSLHKTAFQQESASVPTWMFLSWIPQLLANMNSDNIYAIDSIIMRITETYPQAIMYPYRLSRENFNMLNPHLSQLVQRMDKLLLNEEYSTFIKAMGNVCIPELKLLYYVDKMRKNVEKTVELEKIRAFVLSDFYDEQPDSNDFQCLHGNVFKRIKGFEKYFREFKGDQLAELSEKLRNDSSRNKSLLLKDYCPWLVNFSSSKMNVELEIPGQYDGKKMPLPQYHVKIHKFHPEIVILKSLRKPVKLTILGNDTKEYPYLLKFGEDVRQDQRVQQLFDIMNDIFQKAGTYSQQITLETFQVIPLTSSLGMIRWIDQTIELETFMAQCMNGMKLKNSQVGAKYEEFIFKSLKGANSKKIAYGECARNRHRNEVISNYQKAVNNFDRDILRKAFWKMSTSTESYIALHHNFMLSYAVMCAAHWILGIGDRHLSNTLVSLETGRVIGIDFGCAFGTATQMLAVPELIPFRLTPQIVSFMGPLGVKGHFRGSMINTIKCLEEYKKLLVATMSVFIKEPSLNWLEIPRTIQPECETSSIWYPKHKINQVKRKLEGINSTVVVKEDLKDGQVQEYLNAYCKLVDGTTEYDYRAQIGRVGLSVEEQVDCLIDHAGDYNLLGRTYVGWSPWI